MVPKSVVDRIVTSIREQGDRADLRAIGLRSRIGKGTCQGAFCSIRITAHMYDEGELHAGEGLVNLRQFPKSTLERNTPCSLGCVTHPGRTAGGHALRSFWPGIVD